MSMSRRAPCAPAPPSLRDSGLSLSR
jgi:hypothetical protein